MRLRSDEFGLLIFGIYDPTIVSVHLNKWRIKMKICVLFGGQHKKGNTAALLGQFLEGATAKGHAVRRFDVAFMDIRPCLGCMGCKKKGNGCVQKDDMNAIYDAIKESDMIVLSSPMYWWNLSGPLKNVVDRFFALPFNTQIESSAFAGKKLMLIMTSGQPRERDGSEGLQAILEKMCSFTGMEWAGILSTGTGTRAIAEQNDVLKDAYERGLAL